VATGEKTMGQNEDKLKDKIIAHAQDGYIDTGEEAGIENLAADLGLGAKCESIIGEYCERYKAVREKKVLGEINANINRQYGDGKLSPKQAEDVKKMARALIPEGNKDPQDAEAQLLEALNDKLLRDRVKKGSGAVVVSVVAVVAISAVLAYTYLKEPDIHEVHVPGETKVIDSTAYNLRSQDQVDIDDLLRRALMYVEQAQYTDPPERSAKAALDNIRNIDPKGQYRGTDVRALVDQIVDEYIALAHKSYGSNDMDGVKRWLNRARLFNRNSELIREKEREFGIVGVER